jgi:hypothetical protein
MSKLRTKVFSITQQSWMLFQRMFARSVGLALLTAVGMACVYYMVDSGMSDRYALVRSFPEFIPLMLAAVKLTFIEMSVFWVRFCTQPTINAQTSVGQVLDNAYTYPMAVAVVHAINSLVWAFRIGVLIFLAQ